MKDAEFLGEINFSRGEVYLGVTKDTDTIEKATRVANLMVYAHMTENNIPGKCYAKFSRAYVGQGAGVYVFNIFLDEGADLS